jgi:hypothetical protein
MMHVTFRECIQYLPFWLAAEYARKRRKGAMNSKKKEGMER